MCCNILDTWTGEFNRSCCPGVGAINLFSIGSKPGTVKLTTLSTSSPSSTRSSRSENITSLNSLPSSSAALFQTAQPTTTSSDQTALPASTSAPTHSRSKGSTIAMAVGISVGALVLIIATYLIYRRLQRRNKKNPIQDHSVEEEEEVTELEEDCYAKELNGHQEHELPSSGHQDHELSSSDPQVNEMPSSGHQGHELPSYEQHNSEKRPAKSRYSRQELAG